LRRNPAQVTMASVDSGDIRHSIGCEWWEVQWWQVRSAGAHTHPPHLVTIWREKKIPPSIPPRHDGLIVETPNCKT
jgi:hypothetical protein